MKKALLNLLALMLPLTLIAQTRINLVLVMDDTARSYYSHTAWNVTHVENPPVDSTLHFFDEAISIMVDSCYLMIRVHPDSSWTPINPTFGDSFRPIRRSPYLYFRNYLNLITLFIRHPEMAKMFTSGRQIEIKYRALLSAGNAPFSSYYSNVKTIYIPPPTQNDIDALQYLKDQNVKGIINFSCVDSHEPGRYEVWEYIVNNYPNSIIADLAKEVLINIDYQDRRRTEGGSPALQQWYNTQRAMLLNTKSDLLRNMLLGKF